MNTIMKRAAQFVVSLIKIILSFFYYSKGEKDNSLKSKRIEMVLYILFLTECCFI